MNLTPMKAQKLQYKLNMKRILSLLGVVTLLATSGCLYSDGRGRGYAHEPEREHGHYESHADFEGPPAVVVRVPEVVVRPPEVIVR